jgi:NAD(P)H dehydrogenase (quinone)
MYAITGITGKVGGELARRLLAAGEPVRAVVRDETKAQTWAAQGCEIALADMADTEALTRAFTGADGVFILPPSDFDPKPGYPEARVVIDAVAAALAKARPNKVLCLSTIGADAPHDNLLTQRTQMEQALGALDLPVTFLRPGWFMENALWDVATARDEGVLHSFLQPADRPIPMVAVKDIGMLACELIRQDSQSKDWQAKDSQGKRIVELEGPARVSPNDLAQAFATALGRSVRVEIVPRSSWETLFRAQGANNPLPRIRMLDGFCEGWIEFRDHGRHAVKGSTQLAEVIAALVAGTN